MTANAAAIFTKDDLRAEIERESGGKQTVLYTAKGQPTYMNVVPAFRCEDLGPGFGTGLHPAFLVGGIEKSEIFIGTYQAVIRDGEALSLPGEDPATGINFDTALAACLAAGEGWHLMTNWEWAAVALWCAKNGFGKLRGNTAYGKSHAAPEEKGTISQYGRTLTGSGPDAWRHDGTPFGIADLAGNVWEWNGGLKLVSGRILMPADNNYTLPEDQWPDVGLCIDIPDSGLQLSDTITCRDYEGDDFASLTVKEGLEVPVSLKQALLYPMTEQPLEGRFWADNSKDFEALPIRGGDWFIGAWAGLAALYLGDERFGRDGGVGVRPAFIG